MNENIIIENAVEEAVEKAPSKVLVGCGAAGAALLVGGLVYKFVVKPISQKIKNKNAEESYEEESSEDDYREIEE